LTDTSKRHKLSHEILGLIGLSAGISVVLFLLLSTVATGVAETYCFRHDVPMTEFDWIAVDQWIFGVSAFLSCCCFSVLFLSLLGDRIAYIQKITAGIDKLQAPADTVSIPLEGNNELTALAHAVNTMSHTRQQLREKELALAEEKEQLIRTLCHDIRTPLTSILAYSDYLAQREDISAAEQNAYLQLIRTKSLQIRELTAVLLDGTRRHLEQFDNGKLLMEQIAAEFVEELEAQFTVTADLSRCPLFSVRLDVQELRRVFDNLCSNVRKYADPDKPVTLTIQYENGILLIRQFNHVLPSKEPSESYGIGLNSIRRIAGGYGGSVCVEENGAQFGISISLCDI